MLEDALREAFLKTDEEFSSNGTAGLVGSTAVVALVGTKRVWIANCGMYMVMMQCVPSKQLAAAAMTLLEDVCNVSFVPVLCKQHQCVYENRLL